MTDEDLFEAPGGGSEKVHLPWRRQGMKRPMDRGHRDALFPEAAAEEELPDSKKTRTLSGLHVCVEDPAMTEPFIIAAMERIEDDNDPPSVKTIERILSSLTISRTRNPDEVDKEYPHMNDDKLHGRKHFV